MQVRYSTIMSSRHVKRALCTPYRHVTAALCGCPVTVDYAYHRMLLCCLAPVTHGLARGGCCKSKVASSKLLYHCQVRDAEHRSCVCRSHGLDIGTCCPNSLQSPNSVGYFIGCLVIVLSYCIESLQYNIQYNWLC